MPTQFAPLCYESKHLSCVLNLKSLEENGTFAGYASVFHLVDSQQDVILPGAFQRSLAEQGSGNVKLLWQHRTDEPIGVFTTIYEDNIGLYVEGKLLLEVQKAREAYALLQSGAIRGLSIGYTPVDFDYDPERNIRRIYEVNLWEISLVTFPANPESQVTLVKQTPPADIRTFEHFLRTHGFSRKEAKAIALYGFKEETKGMEELQREIARAVQILHC